MISKAPHGLGCISAIEEMRSLFFLAQPGFCLGLHLNYAGVMEHCVCAENTKKNALGPRKDAVLMTLSTRTN